MDKLWTKRKKPTPLDWDCLSTTTEVCEVMTEGQGSSRNSLDYNSCESEKLV